MSIASHAPLLATLQHFLNIAFLGSALISDQLLGSALISARLIDSALYQISAPRLGALISARLCSALISAQLRLRLDSSLLMYMNQILARSFYLPDPGTQLVSFYTINPNLARGLLPSISLPPSHPPHHLSSSLYTLTSSIFIKTCRPNPGTRLAPSYGSILYLTSSIL